MSISLIYHAFGIKAKYDFVKYEFKNAGYPPFFNMILKTAVTMTH